MPTLHIYAPAETGDDVVDHGKPHAGPRPHLLGGEERLEYPVSDLLRDAGAVVFDAYGYMGSIAGSCDGKPQTVASALECVLDNIEKDLAEERRITEITGKLFVISADFRP